MKQSDFAAYLGSESETGGSGSDVALSVSGSDDEEDSGAEMSHKVCMGDLLVVVLVFI